jgi:hypothetical protein
VSAAFIAQTAFKGIFKFSLRLTEKLTWYELIFVLHDEMRSLSKSLTSNQECH